jgi:hypothetical protein
MKIFSAVCFINLIFRDKCACPHTLRRLPSLFSIIGPTYMILVVPSNASDNVYRTIIAQSSVHWAMTSCIQVDLTSSLTLLCESSFFFCWSKTQKILSMTFIRSNSYDMFGNFNMLAAWFSFWLHGLYSCQFSCFVALLCEQPQTEKEIEGDDMWDMKVEGRNQEREK